MSGCLFCQKGITMKQQYIELMEQVMGAYTQERIEDYLQRVRQQGVSEHGFPRLTANIGILLSFGRCGHLKPLFEEMMDICCREAAGAFSRYYEAGTEFSTRELISAIFALEKTQLFSEEKLRQWKDGLRDINPETAYRVVVKPPIGRASNWVSFSVASEQARKAAGLAEDNDDFIDRQLLSQLLGFENSGMYREGEAHPVVYDLTPRLQMAVALYFGYSGRYADQLEQLLLRGAECSLYMQSVTGELPYGGRSTQFIHNEAAQGACFEFAAWACSRKGDSEKAARYKAAAELSKAAVASFLQGQTKYHVKNRYPNDSKFGCEKYAYFDKYMVTAASFLYVAWLFSDDAIQPGQCPAEAENYIFHTSEAFHKTFCKYGTYFLQYDTAADMHYDANGLGRVHRKGAPSALCLSVPFARKPTYHIGTENPSEMSICCGITDADGVHMSCQEDTRYILLDQEQTKDCVQLTWLCRLPNGEVFRECCRVDDDGVHLRYWGDQPLQCFLPVFVSDGAGQSVIEQTPDGLQVNWEGWKCTYTVNAQLHDSEKLYANRNGQYKVYTAQGQNSLALHISMEENKNKS